MTYLSKIIYGPEHLSVDDLAEVMSQAFRARNLILTKEQVISVISKSVESRNSVLRRRPDGYLVVYYLDFFPVLDEVFEGAARVAGLDIDGLEDWTKSVPEVGDLLSELTAEALSHLRKVTGQGAIRQ